MIEYSPFWNTLKNSTESTYTLITKYHVSSATIDKLRKNKPMNTTTLNDLCRIFNCQIQDICQYTPKQRPTLVSLHCRLFSSLVEFHNLKVLTLLSK